MTHAKTIQSVGPAPKVVATHAVALYDPETGRISHMHRVLTLEGGARHGPEYHEQNARVHAEKAGHPVKSLRALHVPNFQSTGSRFRVDVKGQCLVEVPMRQKER